MRDRTETSQDVDILDGLLRMDLSIPYYIIQCWKLFTMNTENINIDLDYVVQDYPNYIKQFVTISNRDGVDRDDIRDRINNI